jgi:hypothetical protein
MFGPSRTRFLSILALSFLLSLPGLVMAEHLHETATEEISCDYCGHSGPAAAGESGRCASSAPEPQKVEDKPAFISIESYLIHRHPRGPPLLR